MHTITTTRPYTCSTRTSPSKRSIQGSPLRYPEMHWRFTKLHSKAECIGKPRRAIDNETRETSNSEVVLKEVDLYPFSTSNLSDTVQHDQRSEALQELQFFARSFPESNEPENIQNHRNTVLQHHRPSANPIGEHGLDCVRTAFKRMGHKLVENQVPFQQPMRTTPIDLSDLIAPQDPESTKSNIENVFTSPTLPSKRTWGDCGVLIVDSSIHSIKVTCKKLPSPARKLSSGHTQRGLSRPNTSTHHNLVQSNTQIIPARRSRYGPWYVPQGEWWQLYSAQGSNTVHALPILPVSECHQQNQRNLARLKAEVPATYIGREYRNYIVGKGLSLPTYLRS